MVVIKGSNPIIRISQDSPGFLGLMELRLYYLYEWSYNLVTRVIQPINGVQTLLRTGRIIVMMWCLGSTRHHSKKLKVWICAHECSFSACSTMVVVVAAIGWQGRSHREKRTMFTASKNKITEDKTVHHLYPYAPIPSASGFWVPSHTWNTKYLEHYCSVYLT